MTNKPSKLVKSELSVRATADLEEEVKKEIADAHLSEGQESIADLIEEKREEDVKRRPGGQG